MVRHLLAMADLTAADIAAILSLAESGPSPVLRGKGAALYFEKPSSRTRNSMEMAVVQLGGHPVYLQRDELGIGTRESVADVARTLACYHALIAARVFDHDVVEGLADASPVPVINMLSGSEHPLQALADLLTIKQLLGRIEGVRVAFVGDGNNVARSLAVGCAALGAEFVIASPEGYGLGDEAGAIRQTTDPREAVEGADIVYTDVWVSMGDTDSTDRRTAFEPFGVDEALMGSAAPGAFFLHCLPAHRGEEVSAGVIDGPQSAVWRQAENRLHSARGAIQWLLGN